jgi:hypothetical protein
LCRLACCPTALPLTDGGCLLLEPLTLMGLAACEAHLLALRKDPVWHLSRDEGLPQEVKAELRDRAVKEIRRDKSLRVIPFHEVMRWIHAEDGIVFTAWWCLRNNGHPWDSLVGIKKRFQGFPDDMTEFVYRRDLVSGTDLLSGLDWPEPMRYPKHHKKAGQYVEPAPGTRFAPWKQNARTLNEELHMLPPDWCRLTLYAWQVLTVDEVTLIGPNAMLQRARDLGREMDQPVPAGVKRPHTNRSRN